MESRKGRTRLVATFAHGHDFDPRWSTRLGMTAIVDRVVALLRHRGAGPTCEVLSQDSAIDGLSLPLEEAVETVFHPGFGTYLVFDPSRLAYFESEDIGGHYILAR